MHLKYLLAFLITTIPFCSNAQHRVGDTSEAYLAKHHEYSGNVLRAQFGYIDTTIVPLEDFRNNMDMGLITFPGRKYKVLEFAISWLVPGKPLQGPYRIKGNKITRFVFSLFGNSFEPGTTIYFEKIRAGKEGSPHSVLLDPVVLTVVLE